MSHINSQKQILAQIWRYATLTSPKKWKLNKHPVSCTRNVKLIHCKQNIHGPGKWHSQVHSHLTALSVHDSMQSNVSVNERVLCFLLLFHPFIILLHVFCKGEVGVSCADVQHLQAGQVCEGALIHRVHRQAVKPEKDRKRSVFVRGFSQPGPM